MPALRKRLADPRLGYTQPDWIDVDVDPADHCTVHRSGDLETVAADVVARPLDRSRPLWETYLVEGLEGGRFAILAKSHQALVDGATVDLAQLILDDSADVPPTPDVRWRPERSRTALELVTESMTAAVTRGGLISGAGPAVRVSRRSTMRAPLRATASASWAARPNVSVIRR